MNTLLVRLRALLGQRVSDPPALDCAVCAEPATGWSYVAHDRNGHRVIDGYATCEAHRSEESLEESTGTRAG